MYILRPVCSPECLIREEKTFGAGSRNTTLNYQEKGRQAVALKVIQLQVVPAVTREDPEWLKKMVGSFPTSIDLAPAEKWFPHVAEWPQVDESRQYGIAWFEDEGFSNFDAVDQRLTDESFGPDRRTQLPHLAKFVIPRCDDLWRLRQEGKGPAWIYASDRKAVWRSADGHLYLPCVGLGPAYRTVDAFYVENDFYDSGGFLVACE